MSSPVPAIAVAVGAAAVGGTVVAVGINVGELAGCVDVGVAVAVGGVAVEGLFTGPSGMPTMTVAEG